MRLHLLVLRTGHLESLQEQYTLLGCSFVYHQHGQGPFHYAWEQEDFVLELYPLAKGQITAEASLRLGFEVDNLDTQLLLLKDSNWVILSPIKTTPWGKRAVVQDIDGRKVELKEAP